jgi:hypothetical protein
VPSWDVCHSDASHVRSQAPDRCQVSSDDKYSTFIGGFFDPHGLSGEAQILWALQRHISLGDASHVRCQVSSYNK